MIVGALGRIPVGALTDRLGGRVMFPAVSFATIVPVLYLVSATGHSLSGWRRRGRGLDERVGAEVQGDLGVAEEFHDDAGRCGHSRSDFCRQHWPLRRPLLLPLPS